MVSDNKRLRAENDALRGSVGLPDDSAVERIVDAVIDAANIVSYDGYYEIDRDAATRAAIAALGGSGDL